MIDSRQKGRTAELKCRDELRKLTNLTWERTPMSGALSAKHKLKGDLYVPGENIKYCVEVKHYADDHLTSKILTGKDPQIKKWWDQTIREAIEINKEPLLIFKFNRSKWFAAFNDWNITLSLMEAGEKYFTLHNLYSRGDSVEIYVCTLTDFCAFEDFI